jgi:hypothetical protein
MASASASDTVSLCEKVKSKELKSAIYLQITLQDSRSPISVIRLKEKNGSDS